MAEVCHHNPFGAPRLELDGAAIPWNSSIREFQKGHTHYLADALEKPLFLPKDMVALKKMRQPILFSIPEEGSSFGKFLSQYY